MNKKDLAAYMIVLISSIAFIISFLSSFVFVDEVGPQNLSLNETEINHSSNNTTVKVKNVEKDYPAHPSLELCLSIGRKKAVKSGIVRDFCLADNAEINMNSSVCDLITDEEIQNLCLGRALLNKSYCKKIEDDKLKENCLANIKVKRGKINISELG